MRPGSGFGTCRSPPIDSSPNETEVGTAIAAARATWAGAEYGYRLLWVLLLGTVAAISLNRDVGPLGGSQPALFRDPRERQAGSR